MVLFLETQCLIVAVQSFVEWSTNEKFFLRFIDELEKQLFINKTVEVGL